MAPPAEVLRDFVTRFRPDAAGDINAVYQITLTGDGGGTWHLTIADQKCRLSEGPASEPDVTITMSLQNWRDLVAGRLDGLSAYMAGHIQLGGDLGLVMQLQPLFGL